MSRPDRLFDLLAGTADGVFAVDHGQRISFWNEAASRTLGFEPETVIGRNCCDVLQGCNARGRPVCGPSCGAFRASLRGKLSPTREVHFLTKHGERRCVNVTTFVLPTRWHDVSLLAHVFRESGAAVARVTGWETALSENPHPARPPSIRPPAPRDALTRRETQILQLLAAGASTERICARLEIHATTARTHVQHVLGKLGAHSRLEAVAAARRHGLLGSG